MLKKNQKVYNKNSSDNNDSDSTSFGAGVISDIVIKERKGRRH